MQELQSRLAVWKVICRRRGIVEATCFVVIDLDRPGFGLNEEREGRGG